MKIKIIIVILSFAFIYASTIAQNNSIQKNHFSINLASGIISGEAGLYFDRRISDKLGFQLSYGYRFYNFNLVESGGYGPSVLYFPQHGHVLRIGLKKYRIVINDTLGFQRYFLYRLSAWNLYTPKYTNREGSNGLNDIKRSVVSVEKRLLNFSFGFGKERQKKNLFFDLSISLGFSAGIKITHFYSSGSGGHATDDYFDNKYVRSLALYPMLEFGYKIGF